MAHDIGIEQTLKRLLRSIRTDTPLHPIQAGQESLQEPDIMASIIGSAFHTLGYETRLRMVRQARFKDFHHIFVEVLDPDTQQWIPVDPQRVEQVEWAEEEIVDV